MKECILLTPLDSTRSLLRWLCAWIISFLVRRASNTTSLSGQEMTPCMLRRTCLRGVVWKARLLENAHVQFLRYTDTCTLTEPCSHKRRYPCNFCRGCTCRGGRHYDILLPHTFLCSACVMLRATVTIECKTVNRLVDLFLHSDRVGHIVDTKL